MPYKNPADRPYKKEYAQQKARKEQPARTEREAARRAFDKRKGKGARKGKDLSHTKDLARGGSNKDGVRLESSSTNRARGGKISKPPKK